MGGFMSVVFTLLLHVLLLGSMVAFGVALVRIAIEPDESRERFLRLLGLFLGAMIAIGAQVTGVGFAQFGAGALANARTASAGAAVISGIFPAVAGLGLGFWLMYVYRSKGANVANRVLCLVGMLALVGFLEVYAIAVNANGLFLGAAAVPNLSFVTGLGLVALLTAEKQKVGSRSPLAMGRSAYVGIRDTFKSAYVGIRDTFKEKEATEASTPGDPAPASEGAASTANPNPPRDPFDF